MKNMPMLNESEIFVTVPGWRLETLQMPADLPDEIQLFDMLSFHSAEVERLLIEWLQKCKERHVFCPRNPVL